MKFIVYITSVLLLTGCHQTPALTGNWRVVDSYFSATYHLEERPHGYIAQLLTLNDGTTNYHYTHGSRKLYEFTHATLPTEVDVVSGATQTQSHYIQLITPDSIKIISTQNAHPPYLWVKIP